MCSNIEWSAIQIKGYVTDDLNNRQIVHFLDHGLNYCNNRHLNSRQVKDFYSDVRYTDPTLIPLFRLKQLLLPFLAMMQA